MTNKKTIGLIICLIIVSLQTAFAQLSPGELTTAHEKLEGMSNCTACHEIGEKVTNAKCLACHKEITKLITDKNGYHASTDVTGKDCFACHSEHHGRKFQIVHFDTLKFDHNLTGYKLEGKHAKETCAACHKAEFIKTKISQKKGKTYLGLNTTCVSCHADYHQQTLSNDCQSCHGFDSFKPAPKFKHQNTKFQLKGKHADVACIKCHPVERKNDKDFQRFAGIAFSACTDCHKDVHENRFGQDCTKCHSETSFLTLKNKSNFDHNKTSFALVGKHQELDCKKCHKTNYTTPIKHARCADCHQDYHKGQFTQKNLTSDCKDCHNETGFQEALFTIEQHNKTDFKLEGAHAATPCFACHKKTEQWTFVNLDTRCVCCHKNIHQNQMSDKFIPDGKCQSCHSVESWNNISFDHSVTGFALEGKHKEKTCRNCHFWETEGGREEQRFKTLTASCETCHTDVHQAQFGVNGKTDCTQCHDFDNWKPDRFDHNKTRFKLEGGHKGVECRKCHVEKETGTTKYIQYKNTPLLCSSCHLQSR